MKILIKEIFDTDFNPYYKTPNVNEFNIRRASRGVLMKDNKIALLNVSKLNYHKLPGGGIEEGETLEEAFKREMAEEVGAECEIVDQGGIVIEWRGKWKLMQLNYVFMANVVGEIKGNKLTQEESDNQFELEWFDAHKVLEILGDDKSNDYESKFIKIRDVSIIDFYGDKIFIK